MVKTMYKPVCDTLAKGNFKEAQGVPFILNKDLKIIKKNMQDPKQKKNIYRKM